MILRELESKLLQGGFIGDSFIYGFSREILLGVQIMPHIPL